MILIHDAASATRALSEPLDPDMHDALVRELVLLTGDDHDLRGETDLLLIEPGDDEPAIARELGFSPLVDPITGLRHTQQGFQPGWDHLSRQDGIWRMVLTFGSTFAAIILLPDRDGVMPELLDLCRRHDAA